MKGLMFKAALFMLEDMKVVPTSLIFWDKKKHFEKLFTKKRFELTEKEAKFLAEYYAYNCEVKVAGEKALGHFLFYGCYSKYPLDKALKDYREYEGHKAKVHVIYGDNDWMDTGHAQDSAVKEDIVDSFLVFPDCSHQIFLTQPKILINELLAVSGREEKVGELGEQRRAKRVDLAELRQVDPLLREPTVYPFDIKKFHGPD